MTLPPASDLLLTRDRAAILAEILAARSAYVPDWLPTPTGAGHGIADITAGQLELLQQRLAQVPNHRLAVLLDLLGASRMPAQGARTHVLLTAPPGTRGGRVPAGTRVGTGTEPRVVFETMDDVAISPATIVEVHSVLPAADAEQDHSADALAHRPFTLFGDLTPAARELYIGHDELLAFDGRAAVELQIGLSVPAPEPLRLEWTWWDGTHWQPFAELNASPLAAGDDDSVDTTAGLTRSGTIRLVAPVATARPLVVEGREGYWIRGRLTAALQLPDGAQPPTISRLRLVAVNEHRRLRVQRESVDWLPQPLNVRVHWPLAPGASATLHHRDLTTGAPTDPTIATTVALQPIDAAGLGGIPAGNVVRLGLSPASSTGAEARRFPLDSDADLTDPVVVDPAVRLHLSVAEGLPLDKGVADLRPVDLSKTFAPLGPSPDRGTAFHFACATATARPGTRVTLLIERPRTTAEEVVDKTATQRQAARATKKKLDAIIATLKLPAAGSPVAPGDTLEYHLLQAYQLATTPLPSLLVSPAGDNVSGWLAGVQARLATDIAALLAQLVLVDAEASKIKAINWVAAGASALAPGAGAVVVAGLAGTAAVIAEAVIKAASDATKIIDATTDELLPTLKLDTLFTQEPKQFVQAVQDRLGAIAGHLQSAEAILTTAVGGLEKLSAAALTVELMYEEKTRLTAAQVAWEYYDGTRWRALGADGPGDVLALKASGSIHFTVPQDIAEVSIDGDSRRWLRARLAGGSYGYLSLVSWMDTDETINFLPVVEPRPPLLDRIEVFYSHRSDPVDAAAVVAADAHQWRDLTSAVAWPAEGGSPFVPLPDRVPTVYLGLDGELPTDRIGVWVQPADPSPWSQPQRPSWEGWDGAGWTHLAVDDGTDGLRRPGVVGLLWPGTDAAPGVSVAGALGRAITLVGRGSATRFSPGDRLLLRDVQGQFPVIVDSAADETVTTRDPLPRAFAGATLVAAPPARFGVPRTWIRALFDPTRPPPRLALAHLAAHAVEVAQVETVRDEVLGSGDGSAGQVLAARRYRLEGAADLLVRELSGDAADLDRDVLGRTLEAEGGDAAGVQLEHDPRTGRVTAVWVPWTPVPSIGGAGPNDRVYVVDRAQGRFIFGGGGHGRPLPAGRDNVRLRSYRTTDGSVGNVEAGILTQLLSPVAVSEVTNPLRSSGGADVEPLESALARAPGLLRHRRLALTELDVEAIALESSPAVVRARALGARDRWDRPLPGAVRVVIVPRDGSDRPQPGAALLAVVRDAIVAASPVVAVPRVTVEGPSYVAVGVAVTVAPQFAAEAGPVRQRVIAGLAEFLHPLRGGPDGTGWDFGVGAHLSDIAGLVESVPGVDACTGLELSVDGVVAGDTASVRSGQIVCAGPISVRLSGGA